MLDPIYLSAAIDGISLSGLALSPGEINRVRQACANGSVAQFEDQPGFGIVGSILGKVERLASPTMVRGDPPIRLFVLTTDLCNACAVAPPGRDAAVIIHGGLIKAIIFHLELSELVYRLHGMLGEELMVEGAATKTGGSLSLLSYGAASNLDHYVVAGHALPRLGLALPSKSKDNMLLSFARALWFVAQHEVAHIRLGHLSHRPGFASAPALAVAEDMTVSKSQEFEADGYMAERLEGDQRFAAVDYLLTPLDLLGSLERRLSLRSDTHPMALNRMSVMLDRVSGMVSAEKAAAARQMVQLLAERHSGGMAAHRVVVEAASIVAGHLVRFHEQLCEPAAGSNEKQGSHPWDDVAGHWFGRDS